MTDPSAPRPPAPPAEVDRWCDDLLLALRMADVPGERIGEVLAEVRAHLRDGDESPTEAFGAPAAYAAAITGGATTTRSRGADVLRGTGTALGAVWLVTGAVGLTTGGSASLTAGGVVTGVVLGSLAPALVDAVAGTRRALLAWGLGTALLLTALVVADAFLDGAPSATVPAAALLVLGGAALAAGVLGGRGTDPVIAPMSSPEQVREEHRRSALALVGPWLALLLLGVGAAVAVTALAG